jgi:hypothetical protein
MKKAQVNPDLDEVKRWKKVLLNLSRCRRQEPFMNYSGLKKQKVNE